MIRRCPNCSPHLFQDVTYGKNMRVMNITKSGSARCTVCSKEVKLLAEEIKNFKSSTKEKKNSIK